MDCSTSKYTGTFRAATRAMTPPRIAKCMFRFFLRFRSAGSESTASASEPVVMPLAISAASASASADAALPVLRSTSCCFLVTCSHQQVPAWPPVPGLKRNKRQSMRGRLWGVHIPPASRCRWLQLPRGRVPRRGCARRRRHLRQGRMSCSHHPPLALQRGWSECQACR